MNCPTPNRSFLQYPNSPAPVLERSLILTSKRRETKKCVLWLSINFVLLSILLYDVIYSCPFYLSYYHYIEYAFLILLTINVLYYILKIIKNSFTRYEQILINKEQKRLLGIKDSDPNFKLVDTLSATPIKEPASSISSPSFNSYNATANSSFNAINASFPSNLYNESLNSSQNYSMSSPSWIYHQGSPEAGNPLGNSYVPTMAATSLGRPQYSSYTYRDMSSIDEIHDEASLKTFLDEQSDAEIAQKKLNQKRPSMNFLSNFWSHPVTKSAKSMGSFLKHCQYQLSSQSPTKIVGGSPGGKPEDNTSINSQRLSNEIWTRINVDSVALTQWNENLRKWISQTILERLVKEFTRINDSMEKHGLNDIKIGAVGLDRLRKTAQIVPVSQYIPSLASVIPFLEISPNQEYLVKRIQELAKGGCMSEFKWNGGSSYNGKDWDESLPTDCSIVMHLLATYLDTQLMPLPNLPDAKPFTYHHYIKEKDAIPALSAKTLFIQEVAQKPPHFRVVVGEKVYEMVKGYNNLFHTILYFLCQVNNREQGMLGRVNLGRAGVNMLWIIDQ